MYKILVKEHFVVGWFDVLSDEILAFSKYDSLGLEFGIMIWNMLFICDTICEYFRKKLISTKNLVKAIKSFGLPIGENVPSAKKMILTCKIHYRVKILMLTTTVSLQQI